MNKFWMVVRNVEGTHQPQALRPEIKHFRIDAAIREAKRLAAVHPGETFAVLETVLSVKLPFEIERPQPVSVAGEAVHINIHGTALGGGGGGGHGA